MYFQSRQEAGQKLANELAPYLNQSAVVVALSDGAVVIGEQIANALQCRVTLLLTEGIRLPGEHTAIGTITQDGSFAFDPRLSSGEIDEYYGEFHGLIEDQKREKFEKMNRLLGQDGLLDASMLKDHIVILVSDGLKTGTSLEAASLFLKPIRIKRLIIVTPIASVQAVDRMHILADELHCLGVTENYISTNHYYEQNVVPDHQEIVQIIKRTFANDGAGGLPVIQ